MLLSHALVPTQDESKVDGLGPQWLLVSLLPWTCMSCQEKERYGQGGLAVCTSGLAQTALEQFLDNVLGYVWPRIRRYCLNTKKASKDIMAMYQDKEQRTLACGKIHRLSECKGVLACAIELSHVEWVMLQGEELRKCLLKLVATLEGLRCK